MLFANGVDTRRISNEKTSIYRQKIFLESLRSFPTCTKTFKTFLKIFFREFLYFTLEFFNN